MYKVLIRPLEISDAFLSWKWRNDEEIWRFTGNKPNIQITAEIEKEWIQKVLNEVHSKRFAIIVNDTYIGNIQLTNITNINAEYHIFIGDKNYWGKGIAFSATQQILRYAKNELNLKSIYLFVNPIHDKAIRLYEKSGFKQISNEIKMELEINSIKLPTVSVFCMVYNHEAYLEKCLEGLLMQKCLFDFEIVIGEDFSKDKSRNILLYYKNKYPGKFKILLHEKNIGAIENQIKVMSECKGNYIAFCEGDDYWTDPLKLQKQVDFLELNPKIVLCAHSIFMDIKGIICFDVFRKKYKNTYVFSKEEFKYGNPISTVSTMFRNDIPNFSAENILKKDDICGDLPLWLALANHGDFAILPNRMAVYRDGVGVMSKMKQNELSLFINKLYLKHNLILKNRKKPNRFIVIIKLLYCFLLNKIGIDIIKQENIK